MRGLKHHAICMVESGCDGRIFYRCVDWNICAKSLSRKICVASFTDAWIETTEGMSTEQILDVASFTDAWIETGESNGLSNSFESHLLQMRGLKPCHLPLSSNHLCRIFYRCVDWNLNPNLPLIFLLSHLLQMRGLKHIQLIFNVTLLLSHLLQMRGLKHTFESIKEAAN